MRYTDLSAIRTAFARGENVTELLRRRLGVAHNTPEIIEIAYDLQAGSYSAYAREHAAALAERCAEMAGHLAPHVTAGATLLDAGTGEMTTLAGLAGALAGADRILACDLSWSRLKAGQAYVAEHLAPPVRDRLEPFVADLMHLPLADASIDVVVTCHALEPNGGREKEAVGELLRVARRRLVLFEPSFERNSPEGRARMERLGYVRDLPAAIAAAGGRVESVTALRHVANPLNPTYVYTVTPPTRVAGQAISDGGSTGDGIWACPATGLPLRRDADCFFSPRSMLAYPIIGAIPVLRPEAAILATARA